MILPLMSKSGTKEAPFGPNSLVCFELSCFARRVFVVSLAGRMARCMGAIWRQASKKDLQNFCRLHARPADGLPALNQLPAVAGLHLPAPGCRHARPLQPQLMAGSAVESGATLAVLEPQGAAPALAADELGDSIADPPTAMAAPPEAEARVPVGGGARPAQLVVHSSKASTVGGMIKPRRSAFGLQPRSRALAYKTNWREVRQQRV